MKTIAEILEEKKERDRLRAMPSPLMSDPFVTMCAYDPDHIIKRERLDQVRKSAS